MRQVKYGTKTIYFEQVKVERKTLAIEVHPDLSVLVKAPLKSTNKDIDQKIVKRGGWIVKQQRYFEQFLPRTPEREYVSGETHLYLGRKYILRIRKGKTDKVKLIAGELVVYYTTDNSKEHIKHLLAGWYYAHAKRIFNIKFNTAFHKFSQIQELPNLEIRRMKNRWGSCTPKGKIILNPELIKSNTRCIDYVIYHELCHLIEPNHSKKFYSLQDRIFPEWKRWKDSLEKALL